MVVFFAACTPESAPSTRADADTDTDTDTDTATDPDPDTATSPDCTGLDCLTICGVPVAITAPVVAEGFSAIVIPEHLTRAVAWHRDEAISVDFHSLVRRDADLGEIDRVALLPAPYQLVVAGDTAFASNGEGISVVDLSGGTPAALAWWAPQAAEVGVHLVGESAGRIALVTPSGLSLVAVSDPGNPTELGCASWTTEQRWGAQVNDAFATIAKLEGVAVYDLAGDTPVLLGELPVTEEGGAVLSGDRVLVWEEFRTAVLYALSPGSAPVEVGRREDDTRVQITRWDPPVAGGLVLAGGLDDDVSWAIDVTDDTLPLFSTTTPDPASACVVRYVGTDGTEVDVAPVWQPEVRHDAGSVALDCPGGEDFENAPTFASREPGGDRVLTDGNGWRLIDVGTGEETALPTTFAADFGAWLDGGFAFAGSEGVDWGIEIVSTIARADEAAAVLDEVTSPGPFVALAELDRRLWVLSEPGPRDYGDPEPPATDNVLWTLGITGAPTFVALPAGAAPIDLVAGGGRVWVFDETGVVHVSDGDSCALPDGLGDGKRVASGLGAFFVDGAGRPSVVTVDCTVTRLSEDAMSWSFAAADDAWVYVAAQVAPGEGFVATHQALALDAGTLEIVGRAPTSRAPLVVGGERVVILDITWLVADRP